MQISGAIKLIAENVKRPLIGNMAAMMNNLYGQTKCHYLDNFHQLFISTNIPTNDCHKRYPICIKWASGPMCVKVCPKKWRTGEWNDNQLWRQLTQREKQKTAAWSETFPALRSERSLNARRHLSSGVKINKDYKRFIMKRLIIHHRTPLKISILFWKGNFFFNEKSFWTWIIIISRNVDSISRIKRRPRKGVQDNHI